MPEQRKHPAVEHHHHAAARHHAAAHHHLLKDDRLTRGAELTLMIAGNNRTIHEVRLPERTSEK
jgi:hypothetical protein